MTSEAGRALPEGICWCGCGATVGRLSFFASGHDKIAEGALLAANYGGGVAQLLKEHGYSPEPTRSVTAAAVESGTWERCTHVDCDYPGTPESVRNHRRRVGH